MTTRRRTRQTQWVDTLLDSQLAVAGKLESTLMTGLDPQDHAEWTLIRLILCYNLGAIIPGVAVASNLFDIGIGVASAEAIAATALADPEVATDFPQSGWIYRCRHRLLDDAAEGRGTLEIYRDLRAMRKLSRGSLFITATNTADTSGGFAIVLSGLIRALYLHP